MEKKKLSEIQITELFLVKADWQQTFIGEIIREKAEDGKDIIRGSVVVNEGKCWSSAATQEELGKYLDGMCLMKLEMGLHSLAGVTVKVLDTDFFLN